jgi:hypothetical protein
MVYAPALLEYTNPKQLGGCELLNDQYTCIHSHKSVSKTVRNMEGTPYAAGRTYNAYVPEFDLSDNKQRLNNRAYPTTEYTQFQKDTLFRRA